MGRVYRAVQTSWNEVVAINVLSTSLKQQPDGKGLFFARIRRAYERHRGDDRNPILDICELGGVTCVVMTYIDGLGAALDIAED
jgi:hypothetical protein